VKTLKISVISVMMLMLLFLPAMQAEIPVAEACVPSGPVEVEEVTGVEKQQIVDVLLSSPKILISLEWLRTKNIEVNTNFDTIQVFKVNSSKYLRYVVVVMQKTDAVFKDIKEFKTGGIFIVLDESMKISSIIAMYVRQTMYAKSILVEALTLNDDNNYYITYILITQGRLYKIEKPYEKINTKIEVPQVRKIEIKGDWSCVVDCLLWACLITPVNLVVCTLCVLNLAVGDLPGAILCFGAQFAGIVTACFAKCAWP